MANIIKTEGFVLKTMLFKESSLIASIFTKKFGKIKVLAKGVRRPKSKLCGALELFNLDEIIFYKRERLGIIKRRGLFSLIFLHFRSFLIVFIEKRVHSVVKIPFFGYPLN